MILVCPTGAYEYSITHGGQEFRPYRLDHTDDSHFDGGPWLVDVPDHLVRHFLGRAGFHVYTEKERLMADEMVKLRKADGSDATCSFGGESYADKGGVVMVPVAAVGTLCESHGYEVVPEEDAKTSAKEEQPQRTVPRR